MPLGTIQGGFQLRVSYIEYKGKDCCNGWSGFVEYGRPIKSKLERVGISLLPPLRTRPFFYCAFSRICSFSGRHAGSAMHLSIPLPESIRISPKNGPSRGFYKLDCRGRICFLGRIIAVRRIENDLSGV